MKAQDSISRRLIPVPHLHPGVPVSGHLAFAPVRAELKLRSTAPASSPVTTPLLATASDLREIVKFLRRRPDGVGIVEAMEISRRQTLDPRKIAAYEAWGLITRDRDRLKLSQFGQVIAEWLQPDTQAFRAVLGRDELYRQTLEWISDSGSDLVTHGDVAGYWQKHFAEAADKNNEQVIKGNVLSFFHLCHAAELGTLTIGKRGQPARLRVDHEELLNCLSADAEITARESLTQLRQAASKTEAASLALLPSDAALRVLVIQPAPSEISSQVRLSLELAEQECLLTTRSETAGVPISESLSATMRSADAAIIIISESDSATSESGSLIPRSQVLFEISAACVLYSRRVLLLCDRRVKLPDSLTALSRCDFDGAQLSWEAGLNLLKAIRDLKSDQSAFQAATSSLLQ
ncbi:MAG: nucleotide-binding protein [Blastocatellia bacterium]